MSTLTFSHRFARTLLGGLVLAIVTISHGQHVAEAPSPEATKFVEAFERNFSAHDLRPSYNLAGTPPAVVAVLVNAWRKYYEREVAHVEVISIPEPMLTASQKPRKLAGIQCRANLKPDHAVKVTFGDASGPRAWVIPIGLVNGEFKAMGFVACDGGAAAEGEGK